MKGRHEGLTKKEIDLVVDGRIERLIKRLKKLRPALAHYEFLLWNEVGWMKRDMGLRRFFAALILSLKIIKEKIRKDTDQMVIRQIEWSIEQLEEHIPPTLVHYNNFLKDALAWIEHEKNVRKLLATPLPR